VQRGYVILIRLGYLGEVSFESWACLTWLG